MEEPCLKSSFVPDTKRNQNFTLILRGEQPDSLWRNLSYLKSIFTRFFEVV